MLASRRPWVALTGAGVSEASGIPTYRDHHGNWLGSQPIQHTEFIESAAKRQRYWSRSALGWPRVENAAPNATHANLARLEHSGVVSGVITQNVDRLHQQAGSNRVIDLHGRLDQVRCLDCEHKEPRSNIQQWLRHLNVFVVCVRKNTVGNVNCSADVQITFNIFEPKCYPIVLRGPAMR